MQASTASVSLVIRAASARSDLDQSFQQWSNPHASSASSALRHRRLHSIQTLHLHPLNPTTSTGSAFCRAAIVEGDHPTSPLLDYQECVYDVVLEKAALMAKRVSQTSPVLIADGEDAVACTHYLAFDLTPEFLKEAHARCGEVCAEYATTFYIGTKLMTPERQRAMWAIAVWCRRTDELVDGPISPHITPAALNCWEQRLEDIFRGRPYDMLDAALADAVTKFSLDIQPFHDMIEGMRMDLVKTRYKSFDELYRYVYYVSGTAGLMSVPVLGIDPQSKATTECVYNAALALSFANQLTNILRDVGEDAQHGRIYLPMDELAQFGLGEEDILAGKVTDKWRAFMKEQIKRTRLFFDEAEKGVVELHKDSRWPVWASLILYRQILDAIEANDYDNFTKRARVGKVKKLVSVLDAYRRSLLPPAGIAVKASKSSVGT